MQGDIAVLIVSAQKEEFSQGLRVAEDQVHLVAERDDIHCCKYYQVYTDIKRISESGVKRMIVVLNKMDEAKVNWAEERFRKIVAKLTKLLQVAYHTKAAIGLRILEIAPNSE